MSRLEVSIQQAQTIERQMLDMSQWMGDITEHLQSRLDADMLAEDAPPQEYEVTAHVYRELLSLDHRQNVRMRYKNVYEPPV